MGSCCGAWCGGWRSCRAQGGGLRRPLSTGGALPRRPVRFSDDRPTTTGRPLKVGIQLPEVEREVRWPELLDMTRAIEDLGFDSVWVGEHLLYRWEDRPARGPWEAWTLLSAIAASTDPDRARAARRLHQLPQPGPARQAGRHDRRDERRPLRPRPRRRLERDGVPRLRLSRTTTGSTGSRRRSRSSGRSCATVPSTSTVAGTRPATASSCRAARARPARR